MSLITPDFGLFFWMTLIFAILFFVLAKWGFPVITGMVDERNKRIAESIENARLAEQKLSELARKQEEMIEEGRLEHAAILKDAAKTRDLMISQAQEQARLQAAKILDQAREQIASERDLVVRQMRNEISMLSLEMTERLLREKLSDDQAQKALLDRMAEELDKAVSDKD